MSGKTTVAAVLGGILMIGGALPLRADERSDCEKRVHKAEQNLQHEIDRHGEHGKNVDKRRAELDRARADCHMRETNEMNRDHDRDHDHENDAPYGERH